MKLSEIKGEKAIEVFADLLVPVGSILADEEIRKLINDNASKLEIIRQMLKRHTKEVVEMFAILDGVPVDKYEVSLATIPVKLMELFNDEAITQLFTSQGQNAE